MHTNDPILRQYVESVHAIVDSDPSPDVAARLVEECNSHVIPQGFSVPSEMRYEHAGVAYTRNLVYADPDLRFAIVAMVWGPFCATRIHDHLNWCVVRVLEGTFFETSYRLVNDRMAEGFAEVAVQSGRLMPTNAVIGLVPPPRDNLHQLANAGWPTGITLHTYGDPGTRARVFDPITRSVDIASLQFHNLLLG